ncbi:MAG: hypothetical protein ACO1QS_16540 [Verrucomicrobiota bacterium]
MTKSPSQMLRELLVLRLEETQQALSDLDRIEALIESPGLGELPVERAVRGRRLKVKGGRASLKQELEETGSRMRLADAVREVAAANVWFSVKMMRDIIGRMYPHLAEKNVGALLINMVDRKVLLDEYQDGTRMFRLNPEKKEGRKKVCQP